MTRSQLTATVFAVVTWLSIVARSASVESVAVAQDTPPPAPAAPAAPPAPPAPLNALLQEAEQLLAKPDPVAATAAFQQALQDAERLGLDAQQAQALSGIGEAAYNRARYDDARDAGLRAGAICDRLVASNDPAATRCVGRSSYLLSLVADLSGDAEEAKRRARAAVEALERTDNRRARALATLQLIRVAKLAPDAEVPLYERVVADARASGDATIEGRALHSFGDHEFVRGNYSDALPLLEQSAAIFAALGEPASTDLGTVYNSLGRLYRAHGRIDRALDFQLQALALHEHAPASFNHLQSLNAVAVTYQAMGDSRNARIYFERALRVAETASTPRIQDLLRANLAPILRDEGDAAQAAAILEGVIARGLDNYLPTRMRDLADVYLDIGRNADALAQAQAAMTTCQKREDLECLRSLDRRAAVFTAIGNDAAALADVRTALDTIETVRGKLVPSDFFKQQFSLAQEDIYSRAIALELRSGQPLAAMQTAELARSRAFLDLLASRDLQRLAATPPLQARAATSPNPDGSRKLPLVFRGATPSATPDAAGTTASLSSAGAASAASADDLIDTARRLHSTVLAYWVTADQVFIWAVSADGRVESATAGVRETRLRDLVRATSSVGAASQTGRPAATSATAVTTRGAASVALATGDRHAWRELYDLLIKPVRRMLPTDTGSLVTVVPHGVLAGLAFAALQNEQGQYLLEKYTLHYAPAGALLRFTAARTQADARRGRMMLVADPLPPPTSALDAPLPRLPGARAEGRAIARLLPAARLTRLEGDTAAEPAVRAASSGKSVLHFATHAIVRDDDPFQSFLVTGAQQGASGAAGADADGLLTAEEIYGLSLDADLVVLSACRSADGRVAGDGIATFARAFMYAGAPSVIASLWDVADDPTNRLMPDFYRGWFEGASKARALRSAQLYLLDDLRAGKVRVDTAAGPVVLPELPVFWAGFALMGEPD